MKIHKNKLVFPGTLLAAIIGASIKLFTFANVLFAFADANFVISDAGMFTEEINGHTFQCYRIEGEENSTSIAIAWGDLPSSAPSELTIPSEVSSSKPTGSLKTYSVVAIAKGGFSHCTFDKVTVPQSVVEIKEGAFAYCQKLTTFQFPKNITEIAASTFIDCRKLNSIYYTSDNDKRSLSNDKIVSIGDHAFDSCVELKKFNCPSTVTFFGESCFQKCDKFTIFKFPYDNGETGDDRNEITIKAYAFADCQSLDRVTFDINLKNIDDYAFADTNPGMQFYFHGTREQFEAMSYSPLWRNVYITTDDDYKEEVYNVNFNEPKDFSSSEYPGIYYGIVDTDQYLDNARRGLLANEPEYQTDVKVISGSEKYAIITDFKIPDSDDWDDDYYTEDEDGHASLTIPDRITVKGTSYEVKVIQAQAFAGQALSKADKEKITSIKFNEHLVQIQNRAFFGYSKIEELDFTECKFLKEISYSVFNEPILKSGKNLNNFINSDMDNINNQVFIDTLTEIKLPNCLEYLGNFAFYNFINLYSISFKTVTTEESHLKVIGDYAFAVHQEKKYMPSGLVNLELPYSLNDAEAKKAKVYHSTSYDRKNGNSSASSTVHDSMKSRWSAINKNAFDNQLALRTVVMEENPDDTEGYETSFASNVFVRCSNLVRFQANKNMCFLGKDCFSGASSLREMFLYAQRAHNNLIGAANPWRIEDGTKDAFASDNKGLFTKTAFKDLIIYIDNTDVISSNGLPKGEGPQYINENVGSFQNEITGANRTRIPYYFVKWSESGNVKYWRLNGNKDELVDFAGGPKTLADYENGYISLVKNSNGNYTVASYFTKGDSGNVKDKIDLTSDTLEGITIDTIGEEAFGSEGTMKGRYYILPATVTAIKERAFYRKNTAQRVRIVTFKYNNAIYVPFENKTFDQCYSSGNSDYYCALPNDLTRIEKNTFYNNEFKKVHLGTSIAYFGENAFYAHTSSSTFRGTITEFAFTDYNPSTSPDANSYFEISNGGIYSIKTGKKKILLQQRSGEEETITIDAATDAIGYHAAAGTKINGISFSSGSKCTSIFGRAFVNCYNLETISGDTSAIKFIGTDDQKSFYDTTISGKVENNTEAFANCSKLQADISKMTSLQKIGARSFYGCTDLANVTLSKTYQFYKENDASENLLESKTSGVLDLSTLTNLTHLMAACFQQCASIDYALLPNTTGTSYKAESGFNCVANVHDKPGDNKVFNNAVVKLVGETAYQADQYGGNAATSKKHYGLSAFSLSETLANYNNIYYRVHGINDISTDSAGDDYLNYWTAIKSSNPNVVKIILFDDKVQASNWLSVDANATKILHSFPEPQSE